MIDITLLFKIRFKNCEISRQLYLYLPRILSHRSENILFEDVYPIAAINEDTEYIPAQKDKKASTQLTEEIKAYDPQAEESEKRKQMADIYGDENWEKVLSLETSLQLNFNRFCDKELPETWPCIPLNLKYD